MRLAYQNEMNECLVAALAHYWRKLNALEEKKKALTDSIKRIEKELQNLAKT